MCQSPTKPRLVPLSFTNANRRIFFTERITDAVPYFNLEDILNKLCNEKKRIMLSDYPAMRTVSNCHKSQFFTYVLLSTWSVPGLTPLRFREYSSVSFRCSCYLCYVSQLNASADALPYPHLAVKSQSLFMSFCLLSIGPRNLKNTQFRLS